MARFQSPAHRAWWAYKCLDRDEKGDSPKLRELERKHSITHNNLRRFVTGELTRPGFEQLKKIAAALQTTPDWLQSEEGEMPQSRWPVPDYPYKTKKKRSVDVADLTSQIKGPRPSDAPEKKHGA